MSILSSLKKTFAPSAAEAAERRKKVFGTESKVVAGAVIASSAVAAIAAPVAIAAAGGARAVASTVASKVAQTVVQKPVKSALAAGAGLIALGAVTREPTIATQAPYVAGKTASGLVNVGGNLASFAKEPSVEKGKEIFVDNPVIAGVLTAAGVYAVGKGATSLAASAITSSALRKSSEALTESKTLATAGVLPSPAAIEAVPSTTTTVSNVPITPATQQISIPASTSVARRKKKKKREASFRQSMRINILNVTGKYINGHRHTLSHVHTGY